MSYQEAGKNIKVSSIRPHTFKDVHGPSPCNTVNVIIETVLCVGAESVGVRTFGNKRFEKQSKLCGQEQQNF